MPEYLITVAFTAKADNQDNIVEWLNEFLTPAGLFDWDLVGCDEVGE